MMMRENELSLRAKLILWHCSACLAGRISDGFSTTRIKQIVLSSVTTYRVDYIHKCLPGELSLAEI